MACSASSSSSTSGGTDSSTSCWDWKKALSAEMKLFRGLAFAFTLAFTLLLFLSLYLFYLRLCRLGHRRASQWSEPELSSASNVVSTEQVELGVKKELREMLPVIVFKETFSVTDTICSVCLGDYQAEDRLQQIPACKHAFHVECIDNWLSTHTTCPLCRISLLASSPTEPQPTNDSITTNAENSTGSSLQDENCGQSSVDPVRH
ncbi:hypothetical protein L1987_08925 [Smallanthus sonchifolius]|uniref:Uncharacterized protein n=1 Tax=Smallanthus sonchifolius TaxID=185202 RepID=A0ACB9JMI1_9ASTR|nr:hypothetical protein L1987_08925 [Smallanthus sonchifolius]